MVFDIDGTIADDTHRAEKHAPWRLRGQPGAGAAWEAYYDACAEDAPIQAMHDMSRSLRTFGFRIALATGRPERLRARTEGWLILHGFEFAELHMRPEDCRLGNAAIKAMHAETIGPERIALWVDDHPDVPSALSRFGIPVLALHNRTWEEGEDPAGASR